MPLHNKQVFSIPSIRSCIYPCCLYIIFFPQAFSFHVPVPFVIFGNPIQLGLIQHFPEPRTPFASKIFPSIIRMYPTTQSKVQQAGILRLNIRTSLCVEYVSLYIQKYGSTWCWSKEFVLNNNIRGCATRRRWHWVLCPCSIVGEDFRISRTGISRDVLVHPLRSMVSTRIYMAACR